MGLGKVRLVRNVGPGVRNDLVQALVKRDYGTQEH